MKIKEIITSLNLMREFVDKGYELPFKLRRAIRINDEKMLKEYLIFDEERNKINEKDISKEEKEREIFDLLETEIDIELEKVSYDIMETVTIPMSDENMIMFMLEM